MRLNLVTLAPLATKVSHRCGWSLEHIGEPTPADLERECPRCHAPAGAITTYRLTPRVE